MKLICPFDSSNYDELDNYKLYRIQSNFKSEKFLKELRKKNSFRNVCNIFFKRKFKIF